MAKDASFIRAVCCLACGAFSFVMLLPGVFGWVGLVLAVLAIALGWGAYKKPGRVVQTFSVGGIALAVSAALINLLLSWL